MGELFTPTIPKDESIPQDSSTSQPSSLSNHGSSDIGEQIALEGVEQQTIDLAQHHEVGNTKNLSSSQKIHDLDTMKAKNTINSMESKPFSPQNGERLDSSGENINTGEKIDKKLDTISNKTPVQKKSILQNLGGETLGGFIEKIKNNVNKISHSKSDSVGKGSVENEGDVSDEDLLYDSFILDAKKKTKEESLLAFRGKGNSHDFLKNYSSQFGINIILIIIAIIGVFVSYSFLIYLQEGSKPLVLKAKHQEIVQKTKNYYNKYGSMLGLFDLNRYDGYHLVEEGEHKITNVLQDSTLNPVQKKDILQAATSDLGTKIVQNYQDAKTLRESMNKDGFFPPELISILKDENSVDSLQRSLISLEIVKFTSAIRVFSMMDIFVSSFANSLGYTKTEVKNKMQELILRGEKDIELYLNMCYNNPYEPSSCSVINDFENYYKNFTTSLLDKNFNTTFFKQLMSFIDIELEYSDLPNFSIIFNSFDAKNSSIGFSVEVNTFKEDELALIEQGIKTPHIFVFSELIKSLKQSLFILGKSIDARDIKVNSRSVELGNARYVVNNSVKSFFLPIQKNTEREIFDFHSEYEALSTGGDADVGEDEVLEIDSSLTLLEDDLEAIMGGGDDLVSNEILLESSLLDELFVNSEMQEGGALSGKDEKRDDMIFVD